MFGIRLKQSRHSIGQPDFGKEIPVASAIARCLFDIAEKIGTAVFSDEYIQAKPVFQNKLLTHSSELETA